LNQGALAAAACSSLVALQVVTTLEQQQQLLRMHSLLGVVQQGRQMLLLGSPQVP
jgi:hypothetical protein